MSGDGVPPGYTQFFLGGARVVAATSVAPALRDALSSGTLHEFGARHPRARRLSGRGVAFAVPVALVTGGSVDVVIRHNRHGGALAALRRDLFLPPTRAPHELQTSRRLHAASIPTPIVLAYAVYRAGSFLRRSDVVTREILDSMDLAVAITSPDAAVRNRSLDAAATLVAALSAAGARHHDLNVKNVLIESPASERPTAHVLDVDRVQFSSAGDPTALEGNLARFLRSARKWRDRYGAQIGEEELAVFERAVRERAASLAPSTRS